MDKELTDSYYNDKAAAVEKEIGGGRTNEWCTYYLLRQGFAMHPTDLSSQTWEPWGVRPEVRDQGIGRQLVQFGFDLADAGGNGVYLETTAPAKGMFGAMGFEAIKDVEIMYGYSQTAMLRKAKTRE